MIFTPSKSITAMSFTYLTVWDGVLLANKSVKPRISQVASASLEFTIPPPLTSTTFPGLAMFHVEP